MKTHLLIAVSCLLWYGELEAQIDTVIFTHQGDYLFEHILPYSAYSSKMDADGATYLYAACRELGVVVFDILSINYPYPIDTLPVSAFHNLNPTNISQDGRLLYVSLGGYNLIPQKAGMAIIDVLDPTEPVVLDVWDSIAFDQGAAIAITDGEYAYLGAMDDGLVILDVSDPTDIQFVSSLLPDPNYPELPDIFSVPNVRGMALRDANTLMLAYDAGGLRMVDITDRSNPVEIGKYADADIEAIAQSAYNNIAIRDNYAFIPVDMCGMLVVDIADPDMHTVKWLNPWDCDTTNWIGRPGHTNEVCISGEAGSFNEDLLFLSAGDIEVLAYDIHDPSDPVLVGTYGEVSDSTVAWSIHVSGNRVGIALIDNSFVGVPYYSDRGGISMLTYTYTLEVGVDDRMPALVQVFPNPVNDFLHIQIPDVLSCNGMFLFKVSGEQVAEYAGDTRIIQVNDLTPGVYVLAIQMDGVIQHYPFIKQ